MPFLPQRLSPLGQCRSVRRCRPVGRRLCTLGVVLLIPIAASGCVRRRMTVRTHPAGAQVSVDNQVIGTSPAATPFVYYGTREIRIEKPGFRTETIRKNIRPPWYQWPVVEFCSETLWPGELRDERIVDVQLVPEEMQPTESVVQRADDLRDQSRSGIVTVGQ
ncbi:PEGA domain-containing protein [Crateriforma spongiae]|uniref:PEGA domain-containing protein n=1 Tax=Crateriforma spongiae TaxID=2724528 RepID=UPI001447BBC7|nr:PEGA domain-containing protein [Crateriforma spongiae]